MARWTPAGVGSKLKADGTPVTVADRAAETAVFEELRNARPGDGLLGEEIGEHPSSTGRRWIIDGIDWTRSYASGRTTWGTLIALQINDAIVLGLASSPAQNLRWWATRGNGAFAGTSNGADARRIQVSDNRRLDAARIATLPEHHTLTPPAQRMIERLVGAPCASWPWSHQNRVGEGELDACIWFGGDTWDHAAPSIIVEEAGGRFSDHFGGTRLDTRTALYSNGQCHEEILAELIQLR